MQQKIIDTSADISIGVRARNYWRPRTPNDARLKKVQTKQQEVDLPKILKTFSLKGFEFGNWLNNNERYSFVITAQSSLLDLAKVMGSFNLGFDYLIGIAFGARGIQKAAAHYEWVQNMINLTKENGAGSLAHEYGHAIDFNFGAYIDQNKKYLSLTGSHLTSAKLPDNTGGQLRYLVNKIVDTVKVSESYARLKKKPEYWHRRTEIFARTFEQYIAYRVEKKGKRNLFLANPFSYYTSNKAYLTEKDFNVIRDDMDKLVSELGLFMKNKGKLTPHAYYIVEPVKVERKPAKKLVQKVKPLPVAAAVKTGPSTNAKLKRNSKAKQGKLDL